MVRVAAKVMKRQPESFVMGYRRPSGEGEWGRAIIPACRRSSFMQGLP